MQYIKKNTYIFRKPILKSYHWFKENYIKKSNNGYSYIYVWINGYYLTVDVVISYNDYKFLLFIYIF